MARATFEGVVVPVLTPFGPDLEPDGARFVAFCRQLLEEGADGLAVFGTTSEANSRSAEERMGLLDQLIEAGRLTSLVVGEVYLYSRGADEPVAHAVGTYSIPPRPDA